MKLTVYAVHCLLFGKHHDEDGHWSLACCTARVHRSFRLYYTTGTLDVEERALATADAGVWTGPREAVSHLCRELAHRRNAFNFCPCASGCSVTVRDIFFGITTWLWSRHCCQGSPGFDMFANLRQLLARSVVSCSHVKPMSWV